MSEQTKRIIKLFCPSLSKVVQLAAWEDQRIDLGTISRTFGLDPLTIKLNGHFIARGVDLVASSLTWKSMLSFFSARGLSTGTTGSKPLLVDGKLSRVGAKRPCEPAGVDNMSHCTDKWGNREPPHEDTNLLKKTRFRDSVYNSEDNKINKCEEIGLKRKQLLDAVDPRKKTQIYETKLGLPSTEDTLSGNLPNMQLSCSLINENMKRMRDEMMVVTNPCKKIR